MKKMKWNKTYNTQVFGECLEINNLRNEAGICTFKIAQVGPFEEYENNTYYLGKVGRNTFMYMDNNEWKGHIIYNIYDTVSTETLLMEDNEYTYKEAHVIASVLKLMAMDNFKE